MDILCKIANSERDLIRVVVDVVSELREGEGDEEELDQVGRPPVMLRCLTDTVSPHRPTCRSPVVLQDVERW